MSCRPLRSETLPFRSNSFGAGRGGNCLIFVQPTFTIQARTGIDSPSSVHSDAATILPILDKIVRALDSGAEDHLISVSEFVANEDQMQDIDQCVQKRFLFVGKSRGIK
jgi:hypothetical protein